MDESEPMPSEAALAVCCKMWDLTDLIFVRKMENIVFSCKRHGETVFLRLTTSFRRSKSQIEAELHFIRHLSEAGLRVPQIILNANAQESLTVKDEVHQYEAVVFARVEGEHPSEDLVKTPAFLKSLGALMATMHEVSQQFEPISAREHWYEERGIRHALEAAQLSKPSSMSKRLDESLHWIQTLKTTPETYGLVHADLGYSNFFVKPDGSIGIIDFDDACYHFYAFDLAIVIYSMAMRFGHPKMKDLERAWIDHLIEGYKSLRPLTDVQVAQIPSFMDFACLRLYFWITYHQFLNTFHDNQTEHVLKIKEWALNRVSSSDFS